ncbi:MAG: HAMP domain-containing histidine kinase, partial [Acidobacteria bacterium]|nr:HAMP domain-containing histidine kinase [Acidobacteriota bacterium]
LSVQAQQARLEAETASRANDEFISLISHELRTPLNTILGWSSILKNPATKAETRQRAIDAIDRGATTQARLIEDLLDVSRIRRGTLALDCQSIDAAVPVRAAMDVVQATAKERGVSLVAAGLEQSVRVSADKARLRQIVLNLLSNAIKFTPAGGRVTVTLIPKITEVEIEVRDTGVGVRPEFLPHLFEAVPAGFCTGRRGRTRSGPWPCHRPAPCARARRERDGGQRRRGTRQYVHRHAAARIAVVTLLAGRIEK